MDTLTFEIETRDAAGGCAVIRITGPESFDVTRFIRDALHKNQRTAAVFTVEESRSRVAAMGSAAELLHR